MAGRIDFTQSRPAEPLQAGIVSKIRLENFMCHSSLEIELGDRVNFITGQNGSGKSAILTALCVAFGSRAKGTQRASTLKDFIKTGCSHALVHVEMKNEGEDSYKSETYGRMIIIERRLTQTTSSTVLKDCQGRKVATRKEDLREIVEHFNIDVENPCVIMSQDKSREFLHSGNDKDKFKFFFKATLLYQVDDLLRSISNLLKYANELVTQLEKSILPVQKELNELKGKIKSMEHVEEISQQVQILKKKLAWSWAYEVDKQLEREAAMIDKLKSRIPECQKRIDRESTKVEGLKDHLSKKKAQIACLMERTSEVRKLKDELQQNLSMAMKDKLELEEEHSRKRNLIQKMEKRKKMLERQISEIHEEHAKNTQVEEHEMAEKLKDLEVEVDEAKVQCQRLIDDEAELSEILSKKNDEIRRMVVQIEELEKRHREVCNSIRDLNENIRNKVTVFGGSKVINLLQSIERHHREFRKSPIGPIGVHVTLAGGDKWAYAIENALGRLLNAFIVSDHKDSITLKRCAKEANYSNVHIIIYDFSTPKLNLPIHMLPQTNQPTTLSVLHSDIHTVLNVLIDMGSAERQVLVNSYEDGKSVAFDRRISNLKEVFTIDGYKMFSRGSAQTILPPNKNARRGGRLCGSFDGQIEKLQIESKNILEEVEQSRGHKRKLEEELRDVQDKLHNTKRRRSEKERNLGSKKFLLQDLKKSLAAEANSAPPESTVDELHQEISQVVEEIEGKQLLLQKLLVRLTEAGTKASELKVKFDNLCDSGKTEIDALGEADRELTVAEDNLRIAVDAKNHYEKVMTSKVLPDITEAEKQLEELKHNKKESYRKASIICAESEIEALGGCSENSPEQLSAQLSRLTQRLEQETQRYSESVEDLRMMYAKKERKIMRKQKTYQTFREKLGACEKSLQLRYSKFQRNATYLKRELTWLFNGHLGKKGISGQIKVSYEEESLAVEVKMPQDASNNNVRDTRGLSGGERSFSTLCFAMALHEMTEAPFRAMDEFDVFMDAVSRKISLDTLVEFALRQGSQWIFITPHDISMVKNVEGVKKQQMAAPRS